MDCKGPAGVFKYHLTKFGWQLAKNGNLEVNAFVTPFSHYRI